MKHPLQSVVLGALLAAGCHGAPAAPTPDVRISCPAPPTIETTGQSAVVMFAAPTVTGGRAPVSVNCSPPSGSPFPVGMSAVTCRATDSQQRSDACGFAVTVQRIPVIDSIRFVAFGDSITYGVLPSCERVSPGVFDLQRDLPLLLQSVNVAASYPAKLETLLASRYPSQSPAVLNEGEPGEIVEQGTIRLPRVIAVDAPQVLLLQEGANNVNSRNPAQSAIVANGLRAMTRDAQSRGVQVFLGTLLPQRPDACRGYAPFLISPTNDLIRGVAITEGATLVDLYQAFAGMENTLLGEDGLHPNEAGYEKMAETFFEAIQQKLEQKEVAHHHAGR
jgi:lysophospholipase L1-like esterase